MKIGKANFVFWVMATIGLMTVPAGAADTVEPFDVGATDFELYTGVDGLGRGKSEKTVFGDVVLGYGLLPRMSGYLGLTLEANEYFADGAVGVALGIYGTVVDTHHFDFDLFLDFSGGGGDFVVTPSFELNIDGDPEMGSAGVYLRGGVPMSGRDEALEGELEPEYTFVAGIDGVVGAYVTIGEPHQLLLEFDMAFRPNALDDEHKAEMGGLALGYNVMLADSFELISQVFLDLPQDNEPFAVGISTGFIATLPSGQ